MARTKKSLKKVSKRKRNPLKSAMKAARKRLARVEATLQGLQLAVKFAVMDATFKVGCVVSWFKADGETGVVKLARAVLAIMAIASIAYVVAAVVCLFKLVGAMMVVPLACFPFVMSWALLNARV